jgi:hypothetical protein
MILRRLLALIFPPPRPDPDPYGIDAALAMRRDLRLAGWERRARR